MVPPRVCDGCGQIYTVKAGQQRFCSKSCYQQWRKMRDKAKSRARNLRHAETWDGITDEEILERDGWRCQVPDCKRRPIRKDLKYPHPRSKSIDHIIPLSLGGADTAVNKRAAHLRCNIGRGNAMGNEQLALIGSVREPPLAALTGGGQRRPVVVRHPRPPCECGKPAAPARKGIYRCEGCWERHRAEREARRAERAAAAAAAAYRECVECGTAFIRPPGHKVTCSTACAKARKRRIDRERRFTDLDYRQRALAAQDRWHDRERMAMRGPGDGQDALWAS